MVGITMGIDDRMDLGAGCDALNCLRHLLRSFRIDGVEDDDAEGDDEESKE